MRGLQFYNELLRKDHTLRGGMLWGIDGFEIELQGRATAVLERPAPVVECCTITGMARAPVRESLQRIGGAFSKLGIPPSPVAILINLAPATLEKDGAWLDLPLAVLMLQVAGHLQDLPPDQEARFVLLGEIGIHGELRRVPGALSIACQAKPGQTLIVPAGNEKECALILAKPGHEGCSVCPAKQLDEVLQFFRGVARLPNALRDSIRIESLIEKPIDFGKIRGQELAKRAAVISAAGGHNLLLIGPPGEGKSLIASAVSGILPRLRDGEMVELTRIYSAVGQLNADGQAVTRRPVRNIHHSVSMQALVGGGSGIPRPGEITLAHHGILFLDELPEFSRRTLESLRQPMETGVVTITRSEASLEFPARFTLIAAMNPCPCGYAGSERCYCSAKDVQKYQRKLSGPLLDRIDLQVVLKPLTTDERFAATSDGVSATLRQLVQKARDRQQRRFEGTSISCNAAIPGGSVGEYCRFSTTGFDRYKQLIHTATTTTRSTDRLARVSRTIADLAGSDDVRTEHVDEAANLMVAFQGN